MGDSPERLFRDEAGAALERAARLEEENQQLRAEVARLRAGALPRSAREATTVRTSQQGALRTLLLVTVGLCFAGTMATMRASRPCRSSSAGFPGIAVAPARPVPMTPPTLAVPVATPAPDDTDCSVPYTYDEHLVKHYKARCLHPARGPR